jgi:hypothetical protein
LTTIRAGADARSEFVLKLENLFTALAAIATTVDSSFSLNWQKCLQLRRAWTEIQYVEQSCGSFVLKNAREACIDILEYVEL